MDQGRSSVSRVAVCPVHGKPRPISHRCRQANPTPSQRYTRGRHHVHTWLGSREPTVRVRGC
eukprot:261581-Rhodomonas_salina.1